MRRTGSPSPTSVSVAPEIPGLGPARVKEILKHFGSVSRLRAADPDAIAEVRGVGAVLAQQIYEQLRG